MAKQFLTSDEALELGLCIDQAFAASEASARRSGGGFRGGQEHADEFWRARMRSMVNRRTIGFPGVRPLGDEGETAEYMVSVEGDRIVDTRSGLRPRLAVSLPGARHLEPQTQRQRDSGDGYCAIRRRGRGRGEDGIAMTTHTPAHETTRQVWRYISDRQREGQYPASFREIQHEVELSSTSHVDYHLRKLEDAGYIERKPDSDRAYRVIVPLYWPTGGRHG